MLATVSSDQDSDPSFFKPPPAPQPILRCEHGFHHSVAPHSCDGCAPGDACPYWAQFEENDSAQ